MWPNSLKRQPPTTAPTIPRTMSRSKPSPVLFTILLPIKPANRPKTTQARIDIEFLLVCVRRPTLESDPTGSWAGTMADAPGFAYTLKPVFGTGAPDRAPNRAENRPAIQARSSGQKFRNVKPQANHRDE